MSQPVCAPEPEAREPIRPSTSAQHLRRHCECRIIEAPVERIAQITRDGDIPLLSIQTGDTDKLNLVAKPHDGRRQYVVVTSTNSEVINFSTYNTITTCQLMQLAYPLGKIQVEEVRAELCFWLPKLCSPPSARNAARSLTEVYRNAYAVIVADPDILQTPRDKALEELRTHLPTLYRSQPQLAIVRRIKLAADGGLIDVQAALMRSRNSQRISGSNEVQQQQEVGGPEKATTEEQERLDPGD
ncbi:uncharacterized protein MYCFIDRAFT_174416 [Pseudocercospora fijiensis CIRAD86]|uniref:Uncharacterized protein n=1 Tax=Pseudocercospora fijiensis (strain CIRAD86) TaxID=383855 RepID=M3B0D5_PSEFD|nr:uncharacterized protein MYCFIDRAFT_174416 [Pseudocercospora fijiensis CIRAD86]EME82902.1 hypothetical protein MYCFIDRAFT_174416 [Pseudocercospora fijiensis CIRAD86]